MTEVRFKVAEKSAREILAALATLAPWYARSGLQTLMDNAGPRGIQVSVERVKTRRNLEQNSLVHAYFGLIARHTGHSPEEIKVILKREFLPVVKETKLGAIHKGTAELSIGEMAEFITQIQAWAIQMLGLILPSTPEEWAAADSMPTLAEVEG